MKQERPLRIGVLGCGFWAAYQIAGWREIPGVQVVALYNRTRGKADALAHRFGISNVYDDPQALLQSGKIDVADVITDVGTHAQFVNLAAANQVPVICQKPLATSYEEAEQMARACRETKTPLLVHENWRWQTPIRALKRVLDDCRIGRVFRARIDFVTGFDVFKNQPFLRELPQFILTDIGSHILDTARFLFGEVMHLYCRTQRIHPDIAGEDVATVALAMEGGADVVCNMAYAGNALERDHFPQTFVFVEGERGSAELGPDYWIRQTTRDGTQASRHPPPRYSWAEQAYDVVQSSIVPCCADLAAHLRGQKNAETTGEDNLRTVRLVFASYESAARNEVVRV